MVRRFRPALAIALLLAGSSGGTEVVELTYHPCGDTPVFCFGEPRECDGLINNRGEILHRFQVSHEIEGPFNEGLLAAEFPGSGRWGYLDTRGQWAIQPQFRRAWPFRGGLARVEEQGSWTDGFKDGFIDKSGEYVIPPQFEEATDFDGDGFARFWVGEWGSVDRRMGVIDRSGQVVIGTEGHFFVGEFFEGVAPAILAQDACWAVVDRKWHERYYFGVSINTLDELRNHDEFPACEWSLIDTTGNPISENRFDEIGKFSEDLAPARVGNLWGYIDRTGEFQLSPKWVYAGVFSDGLAAVASGATGARWNGFINKAGEVTFETQWGSGGFSEGLAFADGYAVDIDGNQLFKAPRDDRAGLPFCHGLSQVLLDDADEPIESGFIDRKGRVVFSWKWRRDNSP